MNKIKPQFDKIQSKYQLKVYLNATSPLYNPASKVNQRTFYSRYVGQKEEPKDSFSKLRFIAHGFRQDGHLQSASIYDNQDKNENKDPIVRIHSNGREQWFQKVSQVESQNDFDFE